MDEIDFCDCEDCINSDQPCNCDCDLDNECIGCETARLAQDDIGFDIDWAQGRR